MNVIDLDIAIPALLKKAKEYKVPIVDLVQAQTKEPWKVLVATILSARTTDKITTKAVKRLFNSLDHIYDLQKMSEEEIAQKIYPVGFYRNKAKFLRQLPKVLADKFNGIVPDQIDSLVKLPGVGRKTANLVRVIGFGKPAICVDTHVHRIMNIWGYVDTKTPLETEMALRKKLPSKYWLTINSILVAHGQHTCRPISPCCHQCILEPHCPKNGITPRKKVCP